MELRTESLEINKVDKPLTSVTKKKRIQINTTTNERGDITTNTIETLKIVRDYCEKLNAKTLNSLAEMNKFLDIKPTKNKS